MKQIIEIETDGEHCGDNCPRLGRITDRLSECQLLGRLVKLNEGERPRRIEACREATGEKT